MLLEQPAIVVDLDGTLVATDTLWECILAYLKTNPFRLFLLILWVFAGKAQFKRRLAETAALDPQELPYRTDVLQWLYSEKALGRRLVLATAADRLIAEKVAQHVGIFDEVIASDGIANVSGRKKFEIISSSLGGQPFVYAGDAMADLPVWEHCSAAVVVAPRSGVLKQLARRKVSVARRFEAVPGTSFKYWIRAIRAHQWVKNILIFIPIITSHRIGDPVVLGKGFLGFLSFSLAASGAYILNDLCDLDADRRHPTKRKRPFAAGSISIPSGLAGSLCLLLGAMLTSYLLSPRACLTVTAYFVASFSYSVYLKRMLLLDVIALAFFYTLRVNYGGMVTGIEISIWLLGFSMFSFFSLAAAKRINDLAAIRNEGEQLARRAYRAIDRSALVAQAAATGNIAVFVLVLYVVSPQVAPLYRHPALLLLLCPLLLYWFNRTTALANRGSLPSDPILFAAKDRSSHAVLAAMLLLVVFAL